MVLVDYARRYRRWLPAATAASIVLSGLEPHLFEDKLFDDLSIYIGVASCMMGQLLRFWVWGCNGVGGRSQVRDRGPYALMRHPLYAGNFLIVLGLTVSFNNYWAYPLLLLPFACLYYLISRADELRMKRRFGDVYEAYARATESRFLPSFGNLKSALPTTITFNWAHAWNKEYNSCCAWLAGLGSLKIYRDVVIYGWKSALQHNGSWLVVVGTCTAVAIILNLPRRSATVLKSSAAAQRNSSTMIK